MIRVISLYHGAKGDVKTDITNFCSAISLSASVSSPIRKLDVTIVYPIFDSSQPRVQIGPSNIIWVIDDGEGLIFQGIVFSRELNSNQQLSFTAYDFMIYLTKSKASYNFVNIPPEDIVKKVCSEVDIAVGDLETTGISINRIVQQESLYDIIMKCYSQASSQNNKKYVPIMKGDKLCIIEKGQVLSAYTLNIEENVMNTSYKDNIDSMVNRVKIYDDQGNYVDVVEDSGSFKDYGILQDTYQVEQDKNSVTVASNMLHGTDRTVDIEAVGNLKCIAGYAVRTKIWYVSSLADATLYIEADNHTWNMGTGQYTMQLTLNFSNKMDFKGVN